MITLYILEGYNRVPLVRIPEEREIKVCTTQDSYFVYTIMQQKSKFGFETKGDLS